MAPASRRRVVPPTTAQVAAAVSATVAAGEERQARAPTAPSRPLPPVSTRAYATPGARASRWTRRSRAPASRPNAATG